MVLSSDSGEVLLLFITADTIYYIHLNGENLVCMETMKHLGIMMSVSFHDSYAAK